MGFLQLDDSDPIPTVTRYADEGTSAPFMARLFSGVFRMRDFWVNSVDDASEWPARRDAFDDAYLPVVEALRSARRAAGEVIRLQARHHDALARGEGARFEGGTLHIDDSIDDALQDRFKAFLNQGVVALKGLQNPLRVVGQEIGFFYQKEQRFAAGVAGLADAGLADLAAYLRAVRATWSERFIRLRDEFEHEGRTLARYRYRLRDGQRLEVVAPLVDGLAVSAYADHTVNRLCLFVEEMLTDAMAREFQAPVVIIEIPARERDPANVRRFQLYPALPGVTAWTLAYHETADFTPVL
jgi:hypothetical protein